MTEEIKLWVCPSCQILQGIEVWLKDEEFICNCVNCGVRLSLDEVSFISEDLAKKVMEEVETALPEEFHEDVRYTWVSNKTVGVIFEFDRDELELYTDYDVIEYIEDELAAKLDLVMTVFFD